MNSRRITHAPGTSQRGVAILAITIILLLVATIGTLTIGSVGLQEQKIVGSDVRGKEVYSAAIGGLEYGTKWFESESATGAKNFKSLVFNTDCADFSDGDRCHFMPDDTVDDTPDLAGGSYGHEIVYELLSSEPIIARLYSRAIAGGDSHIRKTVSVDLVLGESGGGPFDGAGEFDGPPVLVEECMSGVTGTPDIYPNGGIAIGTTNGNTGCINTGGNGNSGYDVHGGSIEQLSTPMSLSQAVFGVPQAALEAYLRQLEARSPEQVYVVDDATKNYDEQDSYHLSGGANGNWHSSMGDPDNKVILYFVEAMGCPKINGGPVIYGLIYFADNNCTTHGWGNATIYGTVAVSGSMTSHSANAEIHGEALDFGGVEIEGDRIETGLAEVVVSVIPGSWRDF